MLERPLLPCMVALQVVSVLLSVCFVSYCVSGIFIFFSERLIEMPRKKTRRKQPAAVQDYDDDDPNRCWCFCGKPSGDRFLIQCDRRSERCYQWYHGDCVGISTDKGMQMDRDDVPYVCPFCDSASLNLRSLPSFVTTTLSDFSWRNSLGADLATLFDDLYSKIVHWRPNLFMVPTGSTGKAFVSELALLIQSYADGAAIAPFALKALMVMPALLLQKPKFDSKLDSRLVRSCLQRRLDLWLNGDFMALFNEGLVLQNHISSRPPYSHCDDQHRSGRFAHLMMEGRVNAALRCLAPSCNCGPLSLDHVVGSSSNGSSMTVYDVLKDKHPSGRPADPALILGANESLNAFHPVLFDCLDGALIRSVALQVSGTAGPSGVDARSWRLFCTSFGSASADLCHAISAFGRKISTSYVDPSGLAAYTACRLIPLDKNPGVRPIGVGEVLRRIVGKAVMRIARQDLQCAAGSSQLCAGQIGGCEAAVHAMKRIFALPSVEGVLLVDATNAFNELNRQVTLRNVEVACPVLAPILANTYRQDALLFSGGNTILSSEGTTQGDPLAMAMYAIGPGHC